jgi:hypothetical protein
MNSSAIIVFILQPVRKNQPSGQEEIVLVRLGKLPFHWLDRSSLQRWTTVDCCLLNNRITETQLLFVLIYGSVRLVPVPRVLA